MPEKFFPKLDVASPELEESMRAAFAGPQIFISFRWTVNRRATVYALNLRRKEGATWGSWRQVIDQVWSDDDGELTFLLTNQPGEYEVHYGVLALQLIPQVATYIIIATTDPQVFKLSPPGSVFKRLNQSEQWEEKKLYRVPARCQPSASPKAIL